MLFNKLVPRQCWKKESMHVTLDQNENISRSHNSKRTQTQIPNFLNPLYSPLSAPGLIKLVAI